MSFPLRFPIVFFDYIWRDINQLPSGRPNDPDRRYFEKHLAGRPAHMTLSLALGYLRGLPGADPTDPPTVRVPAAEDN
jgi:hypothetical protein